VRVAVPVAESRSAGQWLGGLCLVAALGCGPADVARPAPATTLRLVSGAQGGAFLPLAQQLAGILSRGIDGVQVKAYPSAGAVANISAIQNGEADLAFTFADVAYLAFNGQLDRALPPFDRVRGIAVLQLTPISLVARADLPILTPRDLRGRRVGVGPVGSGTAVTADLILRAFGLEAKDVHKEVINFQEAASRLVNGSLDAMFDNAIDTSASLKRATDAGARLVPIEGPPVDRLRRDYPFLTVTVIPRERYGKAVHTLGVDGLLICRRDLDERLVYLLTKQLVVSLQALSSSGALRRMDVDQAPATPIPLHDGAARYYRERELSR
jgi:TRAP transporter TAXI family solute receptor